MTETNEVDVFVSYAHDDRARVEPLVKKFLAQDWTVWWDTALGIGSAWRLVLADRLEHARAVCVVWTSRSIKSKFVLDEAARADKRGVLVPVRLDPVEQPLGFGELQYADLSSPTTKARATKKLIARLAQLVAGAVPVDPWFDMTYSTRSAVDGANEARGFLEQVRALSDMLAANPGAAAGLQSALAGVRDTYAAVADALAAFLAPVTDGGAISLDRYRPFAAGDLGILIAQKRGYCKRIAQVYIESGGLRDSLPASVGSRVKKRLDALVLGLSNADGDLFDAMARIGEALKSQSAVITNLLVADQSAEADARLRASEALLRPLAHEANAGMVEVERLAADLGVPL